MTRYVVIPLFLIAFATVQAEPVYCPDTGHYYEVSTETIDCWTDARDAAEEKEFLGIQGHLATIASSEENACVVSVLVQGSEEAYWAGGEQDSDAPDYSEPGGGWYWITGEPFDYTNWQSGQPDNSGGNEWVLEFLHTGEWNDLDNCFGGQRRYIVEYDTPGVPTASTWGLVVMILLVLTAGTVAFRRRKQQPA